MRVKYIYSSSKLGKVWIVYDTLKALFGDFPFKMSCLGGFGLRLNKSFP